MYVLRINVISICSVHTAGDKREFRWLPQSENYITRVIMILISREMIDHDVNACIARTSVYLAGREKMRNES